jgi:hypothetical protein
LATRIERDFSFQAGAHFQGTFLMNLYSISLVMEVETDSIHEQNIAMDRIKYFLSECLANSVFIEYTEKKAIENYGTAGIKVCTLPEEPYDQIVALMLILKCNAITEGRLTITDLVLMSDMSDEVRFVYDIESANMNPFGKKGWWLEANQSISDIKANKREKVVKLVKQCDWALPELEWEDKTTHTKQILFTTDTEK